MYRWYTCLIINTLYFTEHLSGNMNYSCKAALDGWVHPQTLYDTKPPIRLDTHPLLLPHTGTRAHMARYYVNTATNTHTPTSPPPATWVGSFPMTHSTKTSSRKNKSGFSLKSQQNLQVSSCSLVKVHEENKKLRRQIKYIFTKKNFLSSNICL